MKAAVVKTGNFREIRIPKVVLEQCRIGDEVSMEIDNQKLVISQTSNAHEGWAESFQTMAKLGDNSLPVHDAEPDSSWNEAEWELVG